MNEVGNHIVDFKFESENMSTKEIFMSYRTFQFREGSGTQGRQIPSILYNI